MRTRSSCRHWEKQSYWPAEGKNDSPPMTANSFKCHSAFGGGSVMILGCLSKAGVRSIRLCEGRLNQATYKVVLEENILPSDNVAQHWGLIFPAGRCSMPHSSVNQGMNSGPQDQNPVNLQTWTPLKTSGMWSRRRWMATSHQTKPGCLNFCVRRGIMSPNSNVKDWWRAYEDTSKLWLKIRVIPLNIDFWTLP